MQSVAKQSKAMQTKAQLVAKQSKKNISKEIKENKAKHCKTMRKQSNNPRYRFILHMIFKLKYY